MPEKNIPDKQSAGRSSETQSEKPQTSFDPAALSAPVRRSAPVNNGQENISPPVVPPPPAGLSNSLQTSATTSDLSDPRTAIQIAPPVAFPSATPAADQTQPGVLQHGKVVNRIDAIYPEVALKQKIEGVVRLRLTVDADGIVRNVRPITGPAVLANSAETAVRQWRYTPAMLDGKAVEAQEEVTFTFRLP
jgi:protein TonB